MKKIVLFFAGMVCCAIFVYTTSASILGSSNLSFNSEKNSCFINFLENNTDESHNLLTSGKDNPH